MELILHFSFYIKFLHFLFFKGAIRLQTALSPVHIPVFRSRMTGGGFKGCLANLIKPFPATAGKRCGKALNTEAFGSGSRRLHAKTETDTAACAAFGFLFKSPDSLKPGRMISVAVFKRNVQRLTVTHAFVFSNKVFLFGIDVRIEVKNRGRVIVLKKPFQNGGGAGRAAAVQEDAFFHGQSDR